MCFIILGRFLLVALVEFRSVVRISLGDLVVDLLDDLVHVLPLAHLAENVALELQHGPLDDAVVEVDHVGRDLGAELGILVHDWLQFLLTQPICIQMRQRLVEELGLVAKQVLVTANDGLLAELDVEVSLLLVTEADAVFA